MFPVRDGDQPIGTFITDYLVEKQLILELKASKGLTPACQLLNYLRASDLSLGLLLNFGTSSLQIKRKLNKIRICTARRKHERLYMKNPRNLLNLRNLRLNIPNCLQALRSILHL